MGFYQASVASLWTTAMRPIAPRRGSGFAPLVRCSRPWLAAASAVVVKVVREVVLRSLYR